MAAGREMKYRAVKCCCGHPVCEDWHVSFVADLQGVKFTKEQAEAIAELLNKMKTDNK